MPKNKFQSGIASELDKQMAKEEANRDAYRVSLEEAYDMFAIGIKRERVKDDKELCERLNEFFTICRNKRQLPTVEKMALSIGYSRQYLYSMASQRVPGLNGSKNTAFVLQQAIELISAVDADLAMTGKINPVTYIFRSKNLYGFKDQADDTPSTMLEEKSPEQLIREAKELPELAEGKK